MNYKQSVKKIQAGIEEKLAHQFGEKAETASDMQYYKAVALMVKEMLMEGRSEFLNRAQKSKKIYYLCMEFLMGRSLKNNLFNLGIEEDFRKALKNMGVNLDSIYEQEPDAGTLQWGILCAMNTVFSIKNWWTVGRQSCRTFGFLAVKSG